MEEFRLNVDGINIAFSRVGKGAPLVLLHGYPLDRTIWNETAAALAGEFEILMPDLRGFGGSDIMEADRSILAYASDLAGLMDRMAWPQAYVVGHSMGGYIALGFAREFAGRVAGLGLISTQATADSAERKATRLATASEILQEGVAGVVEAMAPKLSPSARVQAAVRSIMAQQRALGLAVAQEAMASRPDSTDVLRSFRQPVVIVHGDADALIPVERAREIAQMAVASHYLELPGGGHMPMMENSAAVAEALRFLKAGRDRRVKILGS